MYVLLLFAGGYTDVKGNAYYTDALPRNKNEGPPFSLPSFGSQKHVGSLNTIISSIFFLICEIAMTFTDLHIYNPCEKTKASSSEGSR